jgi:hypothetical protein
MTKFQIAPIIKAPFIVVKLFNSIAAINSAKSCGSGSFAAFDFLNSWVVLAN